MTWGKTIRYKTEVKIGRGRYKVICESDYDDGFSVFVNNVFVADVDTLPTLEELTDIILDNNELETTIKTGLASAGAFNE